jgi:hypothetical protein
MTASEFDLRDPHLRILECTSCDEPVSAPQHERVTLRCGYCGFEDQRELAPLRSSEEERSVYRSASQSTQSRKLRMDLDSKIAGLPRFNPVPAARKLYLERKRALAGSTTEDTLARTTLEWELLHVTAVLAALYVLNRDWLLARAVLETTEESLSIPAYRTLVLTRLARIAASYDAPDLAEKWLSMCPQGLRVPEISSDMQVARAMIARSRGDHTAVLDTLGHEKRPVTMAGNARWFAAALRIDAYEKLGDAAAARRVWHIEELGYQNATMLATVARMYDLAPAARERARRHRIIVLTALLTALCAAVASLGSVPGGAAHLVYGAIIVGVCLGLLLRRWRQRRA